MNKLEAALKNFLIIQPTQIPVWGFIINLILALTCAFILSKIYIEYGSSLSNRKYFSRNFTILTITTMFIITVVKSSLALSLGLVGALSIVRFRTAIKEPEELAYLFLCISVGLGLGADQRAITIVAFVFLMGFIWIRHFFHESEKNENLYLNIISHMPKKIKLEKISEILKQYCTKVNLKRFDETKELIETSFLVEFDDIDQLQQAKTLLRELDESIKVTFMDNKRNV